MKTSSQQSSILKLIDDEGSVPEEFIHELLWRRGDLEFLLWPQQLPIWNLLNNIPPEVVEFVVLCARQFGKSTVGVLRALSSAIKKRDSCILIIGPDTRQTKDIVLPKMRFLSRTAPPGLIKQMKAENRFHIYHDLDPRASDYTEIIIGGMNENSTSQRGKTVQEIIVEEIADVKEDDFLMSMEQDLGPALTHSNNGKIIYNTTLPPYPDHPFITQTIPKAELNNAIANFTIYDNVALTPQQFQACVERCGGTHTQAFLREYMNIVVRDRNRVCLPDFDKAHNVVAFELPTWKHMQISIDWGGVRDKTCGVLYTYDYMNDLDLFWDERVFEPNTPTSVIVKEMKEMEAFWAFDIYARWIDAPQQLVSIDLAIDPYNYMASVPFKPDWQAALNTLNVRFKQRKAMIHPRCKFLVQSAQSAIFNKQKTDYERSAALGHCDALPTMKYAVRMQCKDNPYPYIADPFKLIASTNQSPKIVSEVAEAKPTQVYESPFAAARTPRSFQKRR